MFEKGLNYFVMMEIRDLSVCSIGIIAPVGCKIHCPTVNTDGLQREEKLKLHR